MNPLQSFSSSEYKTWYLNCGLLGPPLLYEGSFGDQYWSLNPRGLVKELPNCSLMLEDTQGKCLGPLPLNSSKPLTGDPDI